MGGRNYCQRTAERLRGATSSGFDLARAGELRERAQLAAAVSAAGPCTCDHPAKDHESDMGCLHGWGQPPAPGCLCGGYPR